MSGALQAAAARGIKVEPSGDAEYPWRAVVPYGRGKQQAVHVLDRSAELAAAEALAYVRAKGWTPGPTALACAKAAS